MTNKKFNRIWLGNISIMIANILNRITGISFIIANILLPNI